MSSLDVVATDSDMVGVCKRGMASIECASCILDTSLYFSNLSVEAKAYLQTFINVKTVSRKELLYKEGQPSDNIYLLLSGEVKIYKSMPNGKQQIHKLAQIPGEMIACEDMFLEHHGSSAEAISDVSVGYLKCLDFQHCTEKFQEISDSLMTIMSINLNSYIRHIANLGQKNALERTASYLVFLHSTHTQQNLEDGFLKDSLSRVELSEMLGITQRTLIRSLKSLETDSLIRLTRNGFQILDLKALENIGLGG